MALIQESYIRRLASEKVRNDSRHSVYASESVRDSIQKSLLTESVKNFSTLKNYDVFLSHSFSDKQMVLGSKTFLENFGYSVYVDWIDDYGMDRVNVTRNNVLWIQERMKASKCLLYATSSNSSNSKWMPWELGFMDGLKSKVAVFPISGDNRASYSGVEYLGIYPYIDMDTMKNMNREYLWVIDQVNRNLYAEFSHWLNGGELVVHTN
jgi:hypothetical protein